MAEFVRAFSAVDAQKFDGSPESIRLIAAQWPRKVARSIHHDGVLAINGPHGFVDVWPGQWITEDVLTGAMQAWSEADFQWRHAPHIKA